MANKEDSTCCGAISPAGFKITEDFSEIVTSVIKVSSTLTWKDRLGSWKARWGLNRMRYTVNPGLYSVGDPDETSPVLVTANYKMSFDRLRKQLGSIKAWVLVLDTNGINVWCAAGKGTFGTAELIRRILAVGLGRVVSHRTIILPQLGAPGVAAHEVRKHSGFNVVYGPVQAEDLPAFLDAGMKATRAMRTVRFDFWDRLVLTPVEITGLWKPLLAAAALLMVLAITGIYKASWSAIYPYIGAVLIGAVFAPVLLPWIPGRPFAWKGWIVGAAWTGLVIYMSGSLHQPGGITAALSAMLILPAISAFLTMNFTGASTYTSLSGVKREMKFAVPLIMVSVSAGIIVGLLGRLLS